MSTQTQPSPAALRAAEKYDAWTLRARLPRSEVITLARIIDAEFGAREKDAERLDWLEWYLSGSKWLDAIPAIRPGDDKYIGKGTLRPAIDASMPTGLAREGEV